MAEISLVGLDLEAARSVVESAESCLTSVRARDLALLKDLQQVTTEMWRIEWKLGRSLDREDRSDADYVGCAPQLSQYDQDVVFYDFPGDFAPGTIGTFFALEGKQVGKDIMFSEKADGRYMVIDREV